MSPMQIIYLNGPSSSGKTTLAKALQEEYREPFLHISFDKIIGWMPQKMNNWIQAVDEIFPGFSWKQNDDQEGHLIHQIQMGPFAYEVQKIFRDTVLNLARSGHHVIIDDFDLERSNVEAWKESLKEFSVLWIHLIAPLRVLEEREKKRNNRIIGSARGQYLQENVAGYDLEFDTDKETISSIIQKIQSQSHLPIQSVIHHLVHSLVPFDPVEMEHITFTNKWISSGAPLFRIRKPATPDTHLVSYFLLIDRNTNKLLLVDHKKSGLWLPAGGHVEPDEHPKETVKREVVEELGVQADFLHGNPIFLTVTETVGQTAGHTDVSLWYMLKGSVADSYEFDSREFKKIGWFSPQEIPYHRSDPHLKRCIHKLISLNFLEKTI